MYRLHISEYLLYKNSLDKSSQHRMYFYFVSLLELLFMKRVLLQFSKRSVQLYLQDLDL